MKWGETLTIPPGTENHRLIEMRGWPANSITYEFYIFDLERVLPTTTTAAITQQFLVRDQTAAQFFFNFSRDKELQWHATRRVARAR